MNKTNKKNSNATKSVSKSTLAHRIDSLVAGRSVVLPDLQPGDLVHVAIAAQQGQVRPALLDAQGSALSTRAGWFRIRQAGVHTLVITGEEAVFHAEIECKRQKRDAAADCPAP